MDNSAAPSELPTCPQPLLLPRQRVVPFSIIKWLPFGLTQTQYDGDYRGFGDDRRTEEMDGLFAAASSLFRAGHIETAAEAYLALFHILDLAEEGCLFTRPDPQEALRTDLDAMKQSTCSQCSCCQYEVKPSCTALPKPGKMPISSSASRPWETRPSSRPTARTTLALDLMLDHPYFQR